MGNKVKAILTVNELQRGHLLLTIFGKWSIEKSPPSFDKDIFAPYQIALNRITVKTEKLDTWDSSLVVWLIKFQAYCKEQNIILENDTLPEDLKKLLLFASAQPSTEKEQPSTSERTTTTSLENIKNQILGAINPLNDFFSAVTLSAIRLFKGEAQWRSRDFLAMLQACGVAALPIITLISLLIGMIIAFLGAVVLEQFGAEIYVSNLIGWGILREMGAIMTGIIVTGRTGAAFAAQIGSMKVNEELDALKVMGISITDFIVLPRLMALFLMMPLLTIYANLMGILGGSFISQVMMDISIRQFFSGLQDAVAPMDFFLGLFKGFIFGILIALSGCFRGIQCGSNADAVGEATTSAVVTGITLIIIANAIIDWMAALNGI